MVVSFMIAVPYLGAAPCGRPHPCYEHHHPDPTPPPGLLSKNFFGTPVVSDPTARQFRGNSAPLPQARPARTSSGTRSIAKTLTSRPLLPPGAPTQANDLADELRFRGSSSVHGTGPCVGRDATPCRAG